MSKYTLSKTQQAVLNALGLTAEHWQEAEDIFQERGLSVVAKRQGRQYVPEISLLDTVETGGGFNWPGGDGESYEITHNYLSIDLSTIEKWMVK